MLSTGNILPTNTMTYKTYPMQKNIHIFEFDKQHQAQRGGGEYNRRQKFTNGN